MTKAKQLTIPERSLLGILVTRWPTVGWWIIDHKRAFFAIVMFVLAGIVLAWAAYLRFVRGHVWAGWTGFEGKTLWDWQVVVISAVVATLLTYLNISSTNSRAETDRDIASARMQDQALQTYLDKMTELLLEKGLRSSSHNTEIRNVARARTLTTLRDLDGRRKADVLIFLYETDLISSSDAVVDLREAILSQIELQRASLIGANLAGTHLFLAGLEFADITKAYLNNAYLSSANLSGAQACAANFTDAVLYGANLTQAELIDAVMIRTILEYANLSNTVLIGAKLYNAKLYKANMSMANLSAADLQGAYLQDADLTDAKLESANLERANLTGAKVTPEQLAQAASLEGATMPDGTIHL